MANVQELTEANFDAEVLQSAQPVLVDFWAPWCRTLPSHCPGRQGTGTGERRAAQGCENQHRRQPKPCRQLRGEQHSHAHDLQYGRGGRPVRWHPAQKPVAGGNRPGQELIHGTRGFGKSLPEFTSSSYSVQFQGPAGLRSGAFVHSSAPQKLGNGGLAPANSPSSARSRWLTLTCVLKVPMKETVRSVSNFPCQAQAPRRTVREAR